MKLAMAIYEVNRAYGGPEEGGWWYDCGRRYAGFAPIAFDDNDQESRSAARAEALAYIEAQRLNNGRHEPNSVLCEGWFEPRVFDASALPDTYPAERPQYE